MTAPHVCLSLSAILISVAGMALSRARIGEYQSFAQFAAAMALVLGGFALSFISLRRLQRIAEPGANWSSLLFALGFTGLALSSVFAVMIVGCFVGG